MATYGTDLTDITDAESGVVVEPAAPYAGGLVGALNTELFIQNTSSFTTEAKNAVGDETNGLGTMYNSATTFASEEVVLAWGYFAFPTNLYTKAKNAWSFLIGNGITNYDSFTLGGDDTFPHPYGGWYNYAIDPTQTESVQHGTGNGGTYTHFGFGAFIRVKISKGDAMAMDAVRYGRAEIYCTGTGATFTLMAAENDAIANRWGLLQDTGGGTFLWKGLMSLGQSGTSTTFSDSNKTIVVDEMEFVYAAFNKVEFRHASSSVTWTNITFLARGTTSPGNMEMVENGTWAITGCAFNSLGTFDFLSGATVATSTFNSCGVITVGGADLSTSTVAGYEGTVDSGAVDWDLSTDPAGKLDDMTFTKGTAATHGIEFSNTSLSTVSLDNITFNSYGADASTSASLYFARTSGTITVNLSNMTTPTYKSAGATIVFVNAVTVSVTAQDSAGSKIENARVHVEADDTGDLPFEDSVTITRVSTTASVAHTAHGLTNGDKVVIRGAVQDEYNGMQTISNVSTNAYDYTISATATYYFDGSDVAATDSGADWSNVTNADDGSIATDASVSSTFPTSSSTLKIEGTNAPASGDTITQVRARAYNSSTTNADLTTTFRTDGAGETLGSVISGSGWSSYDTLSVPSGGWTWAKLQALESSTISAPVPGGGSGEFSKAEIEVTGSPTTPATGTITSTAVVLDGLTSAAGLVEDTGFNYSSDQPIIGHIRKGTTSPLYKTSPVSGTITSSGFSTTITLVSDE